MNPSPRLKLSASKGKGSGNRDKSRKEKGRDDVIPDHVLTLRQRMQQALSLGIRSDPKNGRQWHSTDATISTHAVRAMAAFVDCIPPDLHRLPLIKDSVSDIFVALEGILQSDNETVLIPTVTLLNKLVSILGTSIGQQQISGITSSLSCLLSFRQPEIAVLSIMCLKSILVNIKRSGHKEIGAIIRKTDIVERIICALHCYETRIHPLEYFTVMVSLLKEILWRWPLFRYQIGNDKKLMSNLANLCANFDVSVTVPILQLYSAIALCDDATMVFLKSNQPVVCNMVQCMGRLVPQHVRIEALTLCQHLVKSEKGCLLLTSLFCETIVQEILHALGGWRSLCAQKIPMDQFPLVKAACHAAKITRWPGKHHTYFWKFGIDNLLFDIILGNCNKACNSPPNFKKLRDAAYDSIKDITSDAWDILGWLAMNYEEEFCSKEAQKRPYLDALIACACSVVVDGIFSRRLPQHSSFNKSPFLSLVEPVCRALLQMIFSPCKYISSHTRCHLSEVLRTQNADMIEQLEDVLHLLRSYTIENCMTARDNVVSNLMTLNCYSSLKEYQDLILKKEGLGILSAIVDMHLRSNVHIERTRISPHVKDSSNAITCCLKHNENEECEDIVLLYSLQALAQLICANNSLCCDQETPPAVISIDKKHGDFESQTLIGNLLQILQKNFNREVKWYSSYCLSLFGFYGFPSEIGKRMEKALDGNELSDLQLTLSDQKSVGVHAVILMARCPFLLSPKDSNLRANLLHNGSSEIEHFEDKKIKLKREVRLSDRVDRHALVKLLEFIYTGFCQVDDDFVRPLRVLAKSCGVKSLHHLLQLKQPAYYSDSLRCDFTVALGSFGLLFSDVILEAKESIVAWSCSACNIAIPHMHAHKVILCSNSTYLRALYWSGMQDSSSPVQKVPISWEALQKLVIWFYSGKLPQLKYGCTWNNMDKEMQLAKLAVYVELCSLAEFWCLDEVKERSTEIIVSMLRSMRNFPPKLIGFAANLSQWKIVDVAVDCLAPLYPQLLESGDLDDLDEAVSDMLREGYVHHTQERHESSD